MEENKLIAEFMGMEKERHEDGRYLFTTDMEELKGIDTRFWEDLYFHVSWDWLMVVLDKIESIDEEIELFGGNIIKVSYSVQIENKSVTIWKHSDRFDSSKIIEIDGDSKMKATYNAVIAFIKEVQFINQ